MLVGFLAGPVWAQESTGTLRVGVFDRPPFAMKDRYGHWTGLAVNLWEGISGQLGLKYEYVEVPLDRMIDELAAGKIDLAMGELLISPERAKQVEFSQPYLATPAAAAALRSTMRPHFFELIRDVLSHGVGVLLLVLAGCLLAFGLTLWVAERRADEGHFGGHPVRGLGSALWFAAVTMTTVGYGDKTPKTGLGRAVAFFWMFAGVVLISIFTGAVASSLAVSRVEARITHANDLGRYRTGVLDGSLVETVLRSLGVRSQAYPTLEAAMAAMNSGEVTVVADGEASLRYLANQNYPGEMIVEPLPSTHMSYAFAVRPDFPSATLKAINVALIDTIMQPGWEQEVNRWIGQPVR